MPGQQLERIPSHKLFPLSRLTTAKRSKGFVWFPILPQRVVLQEIVRRFG
jgi:hypothetical protein